MQAEEVRAVAVKPRMYGECLRRSGGRLAPVGPLVVGPVESRRSDMHGAMLEETTQERPDALIAPRASQDNKGRFATSAHVTRGVDP